MSARSLTALAAILALQLLSPAALRAENGAEKGPTGSMILVAGGTYRQGDERGDGYPDERPARSVTISTFLLSSREVCFAEYDLFCAETRRERPWDNGWGRGERPVIYVSWLDAAAYCNWLSAKEGLEPFYDLRGAAAAMDWTANGYRLPTEAEWEYAARGGAAPSASGSSPAASLAAIAWYSANSGGSTHPVGQKLPNALGLYDMSGNVWEWCNDWYAPYAAGDAADPRGPATGQYRALRGGSWYDSHGQRWSARNRHPPSMRLPMVGFRVARTPDPAL